MIHLSCKELIISLHEPEDGFYRGTRFDRSGVFESISLGGTEFSAPWFESYNPLMHDAVMGPAEEFSPCIAGPHILKIGVGLLNVDDAPYDRFRLYDILDPGEWTVEADGSDACFTHVLRGYYKYIKHVRVTGENSFEISHELISELPLKGEVYNHNFFTMGLVSTGPGREIDLPYKAVGLWRAPYESVILGSIDPQNPSGLGEPFGPRAYFENDISKFPMEKADADSAVYGFRFFRTLKKGETVFMGDIHAASGTTPYEVCIRETSLKGVTPTVHIRGTVPVSHSVMWSNHRIACIEPYNIFTALPGHPFHWSIRYMLSK